MWSAPELCANLRHFYGCLRTTRGKHYSPSGYINIRAGINRHLREPPFLRIVDISRDKEFRAANDVLVGSLKDLKRQGQDITKHKQAISDADMSKLYDSGVLSDENPVALQRKVFVKLMLQFGRRGREGLRSMRKDSFLIKTDGRGRRYVTLGFNESTKNHQNNRKGENEEEQLMLEQDHRCPVASFEKYLNKLHPACNDFWQRPSPSFLKTGKWFENKPMGVNTLHNMMRELSVSAGLSAMYTNHCLRATCVTVLHHQGYKGREICSVTGHRQESSLNPYVEYTPIDKRAEMSETLHSHGAPVSSELALPPATASQPRATPGAFRELQVTPFTRPSAAGAFQARVPAAAGAVALPGSSQQADTLSSNFSVATKAVSQQMGTGFSNSATFNGSVAFTFNNYYSNWIIRETHGVSVKPLNVL